jgi:hypothetical protein
MKIPVKIYKTISSALTLQDLENFEKYTDKRIRNAEDRKINNAFKWIKKHRRKQKTLF